MTRMFRFAILAGLAFATMPPTLPARAQVAAIQYFPGGPFGLGGDTSANASESDTLNDDFRKGFSFRSFSTPVNSFASGLAWAGAGAHSFSASGLMSEGAQYGYSYRGIGDMPVMLFGGVNSLRTAPDVFTSITTPGFENSRTLTTGFNAGIEFKPASNVSLSFSAGYVQPSAAVDTDLQSRLLSAQQPMSLGGRR